MMFLDVLLLSQMEASLTRGFLY